MKSDSQRITSLAELDALVGQYVTEEVPETYWEDSHGYFQFHSEVEARRAICDPYYQRFLSEIDWSKTVVHEVQVFRRYSADSEANWHLCEKAILRFGPARLSRESGRWHASFGTSPVAEARTPTMPFAWLRYARRGSIYWSIMIGSIFNCGKLDTATTSAMGSIRRIDDIGSRPGLGIHWAFASRLWRMAELDFQNANFRLELLRLRSQSREALLNLLSRILRQGSHGVPLTLKKDNSARIST